VKITDFLTPERIVADLAGREKAEVLNEMADQLAGCDSNLDAAQVLRVLQERERISTTAIGEGVAIPHGKLSGRCRSGARVFLRAAWQGVDFASLDGAPTHLFFALIAPENAAADHLKALARSIALAQRRRASPPLLMAAQDAQAVVMT
jgi:nitrogen PTS system EIIA component